MNDYQSPEDYYDELDKKRGVTAQAKEPELINENKELPRWLIVSLAISIFVSLLIHRGYNHYKYEQERNSSKKLNISALIESGIIKEDPGLPDFIFNNNDYFEQGVIDGFRATVGREPTDAELKQAMKQIKDTL